MLQVELDADEDDAPLAAMLPSRAALPAHRDEAQVLLDVRRSFTMYADTAQEDVRARRRAQLEAVVCGTLRRYPALHYYQGFHDIASIVLLTLSPSTPLGEAAWPTTKERCRVQHAVDSFALHVVRDSMASNMDPVLGQLKIVRNIVRAADLPYALALERVFRPSQNLAALPWVLTLLSHDVPDVHSAQCVLDFVLSHGAPAMLYVAAALLLHHRAALAQAAADARRPLETLDMPEVHHMLAKVPPLDTDAARHALLSRAEALLRTYPLTCPAVRAQTVLASSSVLFTETPSMSSDARAMSYASLPGHAHVLDIATTPRDDTPIDEKAVPVVRRPRLALVRRLRPLLMPRDTARFVFAASFSLLMGGSVLSVLLAAQLAAPP
ncbi:GTPase-activating protein gyp8 [Malassezia brasiliensis]|uniref:GTPase-activating protein gyp8 n=1 Tax=Malassezia brasiliensis TaxID=1821822 RepID=A0AAF0IUM2_9BASI|nr:GTPase-activating protein gyp8 [Malassezia brasiliensis]